MMDDKDRYIAEATDYGRCSETEGFKKVNAAYLRMKIALAKLRAGLDRGESILTELQDHPNGWVRLSAATHLLPLRPDLASSTLGTLAAGPPGELRLDAEMVLKEWRAGRLKVP